MDGRLSATPSPIGALIPNFIVTPLALDGQISLMFEEAVPEEVAIQLFSIVQARLVEEMIPFPVVMSPEELNRLCWYAKTTLIDLAAKEYLFRDPITHKWVLQHR